LIYKPFKLGNVIEAQEQKGIVKEIDIFSTIVNTINNKRVFIPNCSLSIGIIVNYTTKDNRRVDFPQMDVNLKK